MLEDGEAISLALLANPFGPEEGQQLGDVFQVTKRALLTAYSRFLTNNDFEKTHLLLKGLSAYINQHADKSFCVIGTFEVNRAHAFGYFKEEKYANAVKYLNPAVSNCPKYRDSFVSGLSDTLILLAECYSALGRRDDALHSARLAVNTSHERLEQFSKVRNS
jgi:tetratricopeptide (TPR) repeat protein